MKFERPQQLKTEGQNGPPDENERRRSGEDELPGGGNTTPENQGEEVRLADFASQKIRIAESEVARFSGNGEELIRRIEQEANLPIGDIVNVRGRVRVLERLNDLINEANGLFDRLKGEISKLLAKENQAPIERMRNDEGRRYQEMKDYLRRQQKEIPGPVIEEARRRRNQLLEARGLFSMSKSDFDSYFASKDFEVHADLKQQNVGDCYIVAAIHAMSSSPHFEMICRSSMERLPDGSWKVRVPFMSEDGEIITITPEELLPQKNKQFLRRRKGEGVLPDLRMKLAPVKGKEGLRVLEAAAIKRKFGSVDRLAADRGGFGDDVLLSLGGDNFIQYNVSSAVLNQEDKWEYPGLSSLDGRNMAYLDHYLENFDPEVHIATASTKHGVGGPAGFYKVEGAAKLLAAGHAYSISSVDKEKRTVKIANPWNTSRPIELTFDQFKKSFSGLEAIRIDSYRLFRNMGRIVEKTA
ncbi:MAG: hypothetical protein AAB495_04690 [Patescibacteria group bacterium]